MPEATFAWLAQAAAARARLDPEAALDAARKAAHHAPQDPQAALALAQITFEAGLPSVTLFEQAGALLAGRPDVARSHAFALAGEGRLDEGLALLDRTIAANPMWLDGQRSLAGMRTTAGLPDFDSGYARAVTQLPGECGLRMAWFHTLCIARQWDAARAVLDDAEHALGVQRASMLGRLYLASESGQAASDPDLFDAVEGIEDTGLDLARIRHFLRGGQVERARDVALRHRGQPTMRAFWSYLSLAWRLLGDAQADWLDGGMAHVRTVDLGFDDAHLANLAALLRSLHTMQQPWHEQSVRGGTQTDRPLLFRLDPMIRRTRLAIEGAVRDYIDALPAADPSHPLLAQPRGDFLFSGSWSVRLRPQGFHATHTHPMGWISSALYVTVPQGTDLGPAPAGHLQFGTPPPELALDLAPYGTITPRPGRLALFPSTMWHGTLPFTDGERMTIAFDIVPAPSRSA